MRRLLIATLALSAACAGKDGASGPAGPAGPTGPQGPAGPQGIPGPQGTGSTTKVVALGIAGGDGFISVALPLGVGVDPSKPPAVYCYETSSMSSGIWLAVAGTPSTTGAYCSVVYANGAWHAEMHQVPLDWTAAFVTFY